MARSFFRESASPFFEQEGTEVTESPLLRFLCYLLFQIFFCLTRIGSGQYVGSNAVVRFSEVCGGFLFEQEGTEVTESSLLRFLCSQSSVENGLPRTRRGPVSAKSDLLNCLASHGEN